MNYKFIKHYLLFLIFHEYYFLFELALVTPTTSLRQPAPMKIPPLPRLPTLSAPSRATFRFPAAVARLNSNVVSTSPSAHSTFNAPRMLLRQLSNNASDEKHRNSLSSSGWPKLAQ